jgi:hypothetical protein
MVGGADIVMPATLRAYAMKEIEVRDLDGYILCFGQDVPSSSSRFDDSDYEPTQMPAAARR